MVPAVPAWESTEQFRLHAPDLSALKRQQDLYLLEFRHDSQAPVQRFMIDTAYCNTERPWGYDLAHVASTLERWASRGVKHRQLHVNDPKQAKQEWQGGAMRLDVPWAPNGVHPCWVR